MGGRSLSLSVVFNSLSRASEPSASTHTSRSDTQPTSIPPDQNGPSQRLLTRRQSNSNGRGRHQSSLNQSKPLAISNHSSESTPDGPAGHAKLRKAIHNVPKDADAASDKDSEYSRPMKALEDEERRQQMSAPSVEQPPGVASLVPDSLPVEPSQEIPDAGASLPRYNIYNPIGPRWYQNRHLISPQARNPSPSSAFSPSFPPLSSAGDNSTTEYQFSGMPKSLSPSPLPTPSASQTRLGENGHFAPGSRVRKLSQTHDNVGVLDPWDTDLHHKSPYDAAGVNAPQIQEVQRSSYGKVTSAIPQSGRIANPSPLSQSTSAVYLPEPISCPKTSRRRTLSKPGIVSRLFSKSTDDVQAGERLVMTHSTSLHAHTASDGHAMFGGGALRKKLSSRGQTAPAALGFGVGLSNVTPDTSDVTKKAKHSSLIGRLGKTLSVLRKPIGVQEEEHAQGAFVHNKLNDISAPRPLNIKRIPPPQTCELNDRASDESLSLDIPLLMGNLTIANPDQTSSGTASPARRLSHVPQENVELVSPSHSIAPLPPPKSVLPSANRSASPPRRPPPPLPRADSEEKLQERSAILRVTNTLDMDAESVQSLLSLKRFHDRRDEPAVNQSQDFPSSPLLPPPPLKDPANVSVRSPAAVSVSLSTATFSTSPRPLSQKPLDSINASILSDSPMPQDMDNLPDIATEPDLEAIQQRMVQAREQSKQENAQIQALINVEQNADAQRSLLSEDGTNHQAKVSASKSRSDIEQTTIRTQDKLVDVRSRARSIVSESRPQSSSFHSVPASVADDLSGNARLSRISLYVNPPTPMQPSEPILLAPRSIRSPLLEPVPVQPPSSSTRAVAGDMSDKEVSRTEKKEKERNEKKGRRESRKVEDDRDGSTKGERRHSRHDERNIIGDDRHQQKKEHLTQVEEHQSRDKRDKRHERKHTREHRESRNEEATEHRHSRLEDEYERKETRREGKTPHKRVSHHEELPGDRRASRLEGRNVERESRGDETYDRTRRSRYESSIPTEGRTSRYTNDCYDGTDDRRGSRHESNTNGKRESRDDARRHELRNSVSSNGDEDWYAIQGGRKRRTDSRHIERHEESELLHVRRPERRSSYDDSWYDRRSDGRSRHSEKQHEQEARRDDHRAERDTRHAERPREKNVRSTDTYRKKDSKPDNIHLDNEPRYDKRTHAERSKRSERVKSSAKHDSEPRHESTAKEKSSRREKKDRSALTTETFKLIRSRSDALRLMQDGNAIAIGEEQWTLVETRETEKRKRESHSERHKLRERSSAYDSHRKEYATEKRHDDKHERRHRHSTAKNSRDDNLKSTIPFVATPSEPILRHQHSRSLDVPQSGRLSAAYVPEHPLSEQDVRDKDNRNAQGSSSDSRSSRTVNTAEHRSSQSSVVPPPAPAPVKPERKASLRRAASDLPAGADQLMSLSAREAWDADRAWKGSSVTYNQEGGVGIINGATSPPLNRHWENTARTRGQNSTSVAYSVHTSSSYPNGHAQVAHQSSFIAMPVPIAPNSSVVYAPQSTFSPTGHYPFSNDFYPYDESADTNTPLPNPLPEPPRQSTYSPEPLPSSPRPGAADDPNTQEYWSLIAGIATP